MNLKSIKQAKIRGKRVLIRVEYNVPLKNGNIKDDKRIRESIPTIEFILSKKPKQIILMTHLGRPKERNPELSTKHLAKKLARLLKKKVTYVNHAGENPLPTSEIILLENLRFYEGEQSGDPRFAKQLAKLGDFYVNESFGTCHRKDASMYVVPKFMKDRYAGFLLEQEIKKLSLVLEPKRPFYTIVGFAKIGDKIKILEKLLKKSDKVFLAGAVVFNFLRAKGFETGASLVDEKSIEIAKKLLKYEDKIIYPLDFVGLVNGNLKTFNFSSIAKNFIGYDIGPKSINLFEKELANAKTIFWNGPLGMFEQKPFDKSTKVLGKYLSGLKNKTIVGGGDTAAALKNFKFYHSSTGGGAALEFIEKGSLPALKWIKK